MAIKFKNLNFSTLESLSELHMGGFPLMNFDASNLPRHILIVSFPKAKLTVMPEFSIYTPIIQSIVLSKNSISIFSEESVKGLNNLVIIKFSGANFKTVPDLFNRPLERFLISDNPIHCNVSLCWIRMWNWKKPRQLEKVEETVCDSPRSFHGRKLMEIDPVDLECYEGEHHTYMLFNSDFIQPHGRTFNWKEPVMFTWTCVIILSMYSLYIRWINAFWFMARAKFELVLG